MKLATRPGEKLRVFRELMGMTRTSFSDATGIGYVRLQNVEQKKAKMNEDDFACIHAVFPQIVTWLISNEDLPAVVMKSIAEQTQHRLKQVTDA